MAEPRPSGKFKGSENLRTRMHTLVGAPGVDSAAVPVLSRVHSTLRLGGFNPDLDFYKQVRTDMLQGLRSAQKGNGNGSVSFIRHDLTPEPIVTNGIGQAFVYGGTGYDHSTFEVRDGQIVEELRRESRPLEPGENIIDLITQDHTTRVGRRKVRVQAISGNIAQELIPGTGPYGELDGTPTARSAGVKGQTIKERPMGDMVRESLGRPELRVTFGNDTIAIAGFDGAVIYGTGMNDALIGRETQPSEHSRPPGIYDFRADLYDIQGVTLDGQAGKRIAVNLESGAQEMPQYAKPLIAKIDALLPENEQGKHEIEKLAAGGYLAVNFNLAAEALRINTRIKDGGDLSALAESDPGDAGEIARVLLIRSAMLQAAQLAAVYEFMGGKPLTLVGDGSLITKGWDGHMKEMVQDGLKIFGVPEGGVTLETPDDVTMKGARGLLTGSIDLAAA